jgi:hypothetical protein
MTYLSNWCCPLNIFPTLESISDSGVLAMLFSKIATASDATSISEQSQTI